MAISSSLTTERLILNPLQEEDIPTIVSLAHNPRIAEVTLNIPYPYAEESARFWLQLGVDGRKDGSRYLFAIRDKTSSAFLGGIELQHKHLHQKGTLGYWIGEPSWGQGLMTEAVKAVIKFGFQELSMNRIEATHLVNNPASGRVMVKAGMHHEGLLQSFYVKQGRPIDVQSYAVLREGYAFVR